MPGNPVSGAEELSKGMMKDGAEPLKVVLFIVRHYGVVERLPVLG